MNNVLKKMLRVLLIAAETALMLLFLLQMPMGIVNIGAVTGLAVSAAFLIITVFFGRFRKLTERSRSNMGLRVALFLLFGVAGSLVIYFSILTVIMICAKETPPVNPDAVVVLGCKVQADGSPGLMLSRRIEAAYSYLIENPEVICVASGGRGKNEPEAEAVVIKNKLTEMGIDEERILTETNSASTEENIDFSLDLLKENGVEVSELTIVTDGFHQLRASLMAKDRGVEKTTAVSAKTPKHLVPSYWIREWFGLTHYWVMGS